MQWPLFQIHQSAALCRSLMSPGVWLQISLLPNNADQISLLQGRALRPSGRSPDESPSPCQRPVTLWSQSWPTETPCQLNPFKWLGRKACFDCADHCFAKPLYTTVTFFFLKHSYSKLDWINHLVHISYTLSADITCYLKLYMKLWHDVICSLVDWSGICDLFQLLTWLCSPLRSQAVAVFSPLVLRAALHPLPEPNDLAFHPLYYALVIHPSHRPACHQRCAKTALR